ncbi:hypothetical protein [Dactylosporangium darangshiense]|uniref:Uncharacterized protein n=2 Tax=Dactylosporangium darangshiense TaxID=579108 RepID=A0ABP8DVD0_9ACTN
MLSSLNSFTMPFSTAGYDRFGKPLSSPGPRFAAGCAGGGVRLVNRGLSPLGAAVPGIRIVGLLLLSAMVAPLLGTPFPNRAPSIPPRIPIQRRTGEQDGMTSKSARIDPP